MFLILPLSSISVGILSFCFIFFLDSMNIFMFWVSFESLSFSMAWFFLKKKTLLMMEHILKFFLIQGISSSILLLSMTLTGDVILFNEIFNSMLFSCLIFGSILMKMGLFPFHSWIGQLINQNDVWLFFLLMTVQKVLPIIFFSKMMFWSSCNIFFKLGIFLNLVFVFLSLLNFNKIIFFFFISSILHMTNVIMLFFSESSLSTAMFYFMTYGGGFFLVCSNIFLFQSFSFYDIYRKMTNPLLFSIFMFSGFPPFAFFMLKMYLLNMFMPLFGFLFMFLYCGIFSVYIFGIFSFMWLFKYQQTYKMSWDFLFNTLLDNKSTISVMILSFGICLCFF